MKKMLNQKLYDTETASAISTYSNGNNIFARHYFEETLYRMPFGDYFLFATGNSLSKYRGYIVFRPLSLGEAVDWMEAHADADAFMALFGAVLE